jgi:hypothetical protein
MQDVLESITKDVELVAANLSKFVEMQASAIDSLTTQLEMVKTVSYLVASATVFTSSHPWQRMELAHNQQAYERLNQIKKETAPFTASMPAMRFLQGTV